MSELRILYDGPPLAGRSTSQQRIAKRLARGRITSFDMGGKRIAEVVVEARALSVRIRAAIGAEFVPEVDRELRAWAQAIILVVDTQPERSEANARVIEEVLFELGDRPLILQYNKRDLTKTVSRDELETQYNWRKLPAFESVATDERDGGVWNAFDEALR